VETRESVVSGTKQKMPSFQQRTCEDGLYWLELPTAYEPNAQKQSP